MNAPAKQDVRHLETIARILDAVAVGESDPARGMIACEDAYIAIGLGLELGLPMSDIVKQAKAAALLAQQNGGHTR